MVEKAPKYPAYIDKALRNYYKHHHIRWNPRAVMIGFRRYDSMGKAIEPTFEGRFELWSKNPDGQDYHVATIQDGKQGFRLPDQKLIDGVREASPEHWGGDLDGMIMDLIDAPEEKRVEDMFAAQDDELEMILKWTHYVGLPKCGAHTSYHGKRLFS